MSLSSSRVFVLLGTGAAGYVMGVEPEEMGETRRSWVEKTTPAGYRIFFFLAGEPLPRNLVEENELKEDFKALSSLLHYAWAVQMQELFPGSGFQHQLTYEQICDVVANDVKQALLRIPSEKRTEEYLKIMVRVCRDRTGLAVKALWDDDMARKCGVEIHSPGVDGWLPR